MRLSANNLFVGVTLIVWGIFKKVAIADPLTGGPEAVFAAFGSGAAIGALELWWAAITFGLRLMFDISAYSDIAMGVARLFGVRLPLNMDSPFKAASIVDFWRRWYVTLSRFIAQILYRPMSGGGAFSLRAHEAYLVVMVLFGLWHGFTWSFVLFGCLHGAMLMINHAWIGLRMGVFHGAAEIRSLVYRYPMRVVTILAVSAAWVPFAVDDYSRAIAILFAMFGAGGVVVPTEVAGAWHAAWSLVPQSIATAFAPLLALLPDSGITAGTLSYVSGADWIVTAMLLGLVWTLPSIYESLAAHDPAWEEIDPNDPRRRTALRWAPTVWHGIALGVLLAIALKGVVTTGPDGFGIRPFVYEAF